MVNPLRSRPGPHDDRMRACGVPCNATTRVLWLRAHMMGLTFAARIYPGTGGGAHFSFAMFRGTEDRDYDAPGRIGTTPHQDGLRAWLDGFLAARYPGLADYMAGNKLALKAAGYRFSYTASPLPDNARILLDHDKRTVKIPLPTNYSISMLAEAVAMALRHVEDFRESVRLLTA